MMCDGDSHVGGGDEVERTHIVTLTIAGVSEQLGSAQKYLLALEFQKG